jgi:DNA-binding transcriptional MerR regulator/methylmalonyl-CoA mutase cobalamin-binding subunit
MYTIKEAAARSGVTIPLLRAWERRYGVVVPTRTLSGYRVYNETDLARLRAMRQLVDDGWSPSNAAAAVREGRASLEPTRPIHAEPAPDATDHIEAFIDAATRLDAVEIERILDQMLAEGTFETVADRHLMPVLVALGEAWASGRIDVGVEHAASHAVQRRLSAAFQAAGNPVDADRGVLVGLPPGARHELGALAFGVAARRAGLPVLYLGPDLPVTDWVATARRTRARAAVIGALTPADGESAARVAKALHDDDSKMVVAIGGQWAAETVAGLDDWRGRRPIALPDGLREAVSALTDALS